MSRSDGPLMIGDARAAMSDEDVCDGMLRSRACSPPAAATDQEVVQVVEAALIRTRLAMVRRGALNPSWIDVAQALADGTADVSHARLGGS